MFIIALKSKKHIKTILFSVIIILVLVFALFIFLHKTKPDESIKINDKIYDMVIKSDKDIPKFLNQFGWKTNPSPIEVSKVNIPSEFNTVYEHYNDIQKEQGLDLSKYKGTECQKYTFKILNHSNDDLVANVIVYNNYVIGGDVSEEIMNGFIKSFIKL